MDPRHINEAKEKLIALKVIILPVITDISHLIKLAK